MFELTRFEKASIFLSLSHFIHGWHSLRLVPSMVNIVRSSSLDSLIEACLYMMSEVFPKLSWQNFLGNHLRLKKIHSIEYGVDGVGDVSSH